MRRRLLILVMLLLGLLPTSAAAASPDAVAVFIQGYGSRSDADDFAAVKAGLRLHGWSDDQLVSFSYTGNGYWRGADGAYNWYTSGYDCAGTQRGLVASDNLLAGLLRAIMGSRPTSRIILVGHSFGGLLAWYHLDNVVNGAPLDVDGVVSIDSPLLGISSGRASLLGLRGGCPGLWSQSIEDMLGMRMTWQQRPDAWPSVARAATARGIGAYSLGSTTDCVYNAPLCGWPGFGDETAAQIVPGAGALLAPRAILDDVGLSHAAILHDPVALLTIVPVIERQAAGPR